VRGRPLVEWLVFSAVWLLLLVPLRHVTGGRTVEASPAGVVSAAIGDESGREQAWVRLRFSEPPTVFTVYAGDEVLWTETGPDAEMEQLVALPSTAGGLELEAVWIGAGRRAVELVVDPVEGKSWRRVLWTEARVLRERLVKE